MFKNNNKDVPIPPAPPTEQNNMLKAIVANIMQHETKTGKPFLVLDLFTENREKINAKKWNTDKTDFNVNIYDTIECEIEETVYNNQPSYILHDYNVLDSKDIDKSLFIPSLKINEIENHKEYFNTAIFQLEESKYKRLMQCFVEDYAEKFFKAPSARKMHGNYIGGLLEHSCNVHKIAMNIAGMYNIDKTSKDFDISLISVGALLHDIGKIVTYGYDQGVIDYNKEEKTLGHTAVGMCMIYNYQCKLKANYTDLMHVIASHMNQIEWGAIQTPKILEATIVANADLMDARANIYYNDSINWDEDNKAWCDALRSFVYKVK